MAYRHAAVELIEWLTLPACTAKGMIAREDVALALLDALACGDPTEAPDDADGEKALCIAARVCRRWMHLHLQDETSRPQLHAAQCEIMAAQIPGRMLLLADDEGNAL
jgi:hypothetical protein